jgi:hypothetical protein
MTDQPHRRLRLVTCGLIAGASAPVTWAAPYTFNKATDGSMHITPAPASLSVSSLPLTDASPSQEDLQRAVARVKAEYLFRFLSYVDFPRAVLPQPGTPLVIGVAGADEVFDALADTLSMRTVGTRPVIRRRLDAGDSLMGVHLLFAGHPLDLQQNALVSQARSSPVLLVTDAANGLGAGAVFNFLMIHDQLRFEASLEAATRAALMVSSRVLVLAERVMGVR